MEKEGEIVIYQAPDNPNQIEVRMDGDTIWLTIDQMTTLFQKSRATINEHILNIFEEKELDSEQVMKKVGISDFAKKPTNLYNLDVVISVGYRVNSKMGTQFRIWATQRLKEYLIRGYSINENRLIGSMPTKKCNKCHQSKNDAGFIKNKNRENGRENICKKCRNERNKLWKIKNKKLLSEKRRKRFMDKFGGLTESELPKELMCIKCESIKSINNFHKSISHSRGFQRYCKDCLRETKNENYYKNIQHYKKRIKNGLKIIKIKRH
jgi:hypothetical protein